MVKPASNRSCDRTSVWRDVAIIGGGVAGSAAAIRLRQHGVNVTLIEQAIFPRHKVCGCCIGGAGLALLRHLHCDGAVRRSARSIRRWHGSIDGRSIHVPLRDNIAVSRESLDCILIDAAKRWGTDVIQPATAAIGSATSNAIHVTISQRTDRGLVETSRSFDGVIVAAGLSPTKLGDVLPWIDPPHGPFGVSFLIEDALNFPDDQISMVCDQDGYVGLVLLEDGRLDVAAALPSGREATQRGKPTERVAAILARSADVSSAPWFNETSIRSATDVRTTPPLRRSRKAGQGRIMAIGDAAGYVEPFTGEGMTWAMAGGIGAADWIAKSQSSANQVGDRWTAELRRLLRRQRRECSLVSSALKNTVTRRVIGSVLSRFPRAANPVLSHLDRAIPFDSLPSVIEINTPS